MRARDQTECMLNWWSNAGITRVDVALRRPRGIMVWCRDRRLECLSSGWLWGENTRGAEIYIRPAREGRWPLVFLDDVLCDRARSFCDGYSALAVQTSVEGGCQLWVHTAGPLDEGQRREVQRALIAELGADPRSVSGEHLGRLAGYRNWKRGGCWVNVHHAPREGYLLPVPQPPGPAPAGTWRPRVAPSVSRPSAGDRSPSGQDWAWVCRALEGGASPADVQARLEESARPRRGHDASRYARITVKRALDHLRSRPSRSDSGTTPE